MYRCPNNYMYKMKTEKRYLKTIECYLYDPILKYYHFTFSFILSHDTYSIIYSGFLKKILTTIKEEEFFSRTDA